MKYRTCFSLAAISAAAMIAACGQEQAQTSSTTDSTPVASSEGAAPPSSLRLYIMDCGTMKADPARFRLERSEIASDVFATPCFLVAHPRGTLVWDVGAVPDADWTPTGAPVAHHLTLPDQSTRDLLLNKPLLAQLSEIGYQPSDITYLALSHYHWDHVANANAFANSTWIVRAVERDAMFSDKPPVTMPAWFAALKDAKTVIVEGEDHDVFGDGTVVIKSVPGHTPGHQMLYLNLSQTGPVVLSGDLYHFPESRALKRVPTFDFDQKQTPVTREKAEAFLASSGAKLWIQHDSTLIASLRKAPEYYE
jgi:glyoxylase-like metal-dependent hydrolase (beta-lactamase superfamily II)